MSYLFLFIPAIGWGLMPMFVAGVKKSNIYHQILGTVLGAFIFGAVMTLIKRPTFDVQLRRRLSRSIVECKS